MEQFFFRSTKHQRIVNGTLVEGSAVIRDIRVIMTNNRQSITLEIIPTLSPKNGTLINETSGFYSYRGEDPDYRFDIAFNRYGQVCMVNVALESRKLCLSFL